MAPIDDGHAVHYTALAKGTPVYGSAVASYWVEEFGCERAERLTREEIDERYEAFRRMTSVEGVAAG